MDKLTQNGMPIAFNGLRNQILRFALKNIEGKL